MVVSEIVVDELEAPWSWIDEKPIDAVLEGAKFCPLPPVTGLPVSLGKIEKVEVEEDTVDDELWLRFWLEGMTVLMRLDALVDCDELELDEMLPEAEAVTEAPLRTDLPLDVEIEPLPTKLFPDPNCPTELEDDRLPAETTWLEEKPRVFPLVDMPPEELATLALPPWVKLFAGKPGPNDCDPVAGVELYDTAPPLIGPDPF